MPPAEASPSPIRFIAVHLGASNSRNNKTFVDIAKQVCETVIGETTHSSADEAVVRAVELLENVKSLNCGLGSNLNIQGLVECDASLMSSKDQIWTGVGAVTGCKNPIKLAKSLHDHATIPRPLGLVQPNFLVGSGAKQWMREHCPNLIVPDSHLISSSALSKYQKFKSSYDESLRKPPHQTSNIEGVVRSDDGDVTTTNCDNTALSFQLDTVGAVAVDCANNLACAISSGGIMLKHRGRIGQAALPGAGCWAQDSVAVTTTGVGEYLTATLFARKFHDKLQTLRLLHDLPGGGRSTMKPMTAQSLNQEAMNECFKDLLDSPALGHVPLPERLAGMLAVSGSMDTNLTTPNHRHHHQQEQQQEQTGVSLETPLPTVVEVDSEFKLYLSYGHNTRSLCVGYMMAGSTEAVSFVSCSSDDNNDKEQEESGSASRTRGISLRTIELNFGRNKKTSAS